MKIAIISDIHANKEAFDNVLADIKNIGADKIFCLGDLALAGHLPHYVVSKCIELQKEMGENFQIIQGNTDKILVDFKEKPFEIAPEAGCMAQSVPYDIEDLTEEDFAFLKNLPVTKFLEIDGVKIQLVHGSPRQQDENIYPTSTPDEVEEMVKNSTADLIFAGHTHLPCGFALDGGKTVVNAGSIGRSMTPGKMPVYALLTVENGKFEIEHRIVKYDNVKTSNLVKQRGFLKADELAKLYI